MRTHSYICFFAFALGCTTCRAVSVQSSSTEEDNKPSEQVALHRIIRKSGEAYRQSTESASPTASTLIGVTGKATLEKEPIARQESHAKPMSEVLLQTVVGEADNSKDAGKQDDDPDEETTKSTTTTTTNQDQKCFEMMKAEGGECEKYGPLMDKYCPQGKCPDEEKAKELAQTDEGRKDMTWVCTKGAKCTKGKRECMDTAKAIKKLPCDKVKMASSMCFPANAMVAKPGGDPEAPIGSLRLGDRLATPHWDGAADIGSLGDDEFMGDMHARYLGHTDKETEFVQISHERMANGRPLKMTKGHMLYFSRNGTRILAPAAQIRVGDHVWALKETSIQSPHGADALKLVKSLVTRLDIVVDKGFFAPLTRSGRLLVEGVAVSSYALTHDKQLRIWEQSPWLQAHMEHLWTVLTFPGWVFYQLGLPFMWMHEPGVHSAINSVLDVFSGALGAPR